ncbi:MAG TPA: COX15/CtaA family protein [Candidatus Dormibacteraeota bacterium]|nr:COX15/CtaA family protein [Candidatus Dormibacteraeota bacterium]
MSAVAISRRVFLLAAVFAYLQIALGGVVRVTGSGLGCPDWPLCHGRPYPPADLNSIIEYSHRTVGAITGVLIIATVVAAWAVFRTRRPAVAWLATAALIAVAVEGGLGGIVVVSELTPWLVAVHLGLAMVIVGCLIATAVLSLGQSAGVESPSFRRLATAAVIATYFLLLTGSSVVATRADESCKSWPLCGGGFTPDFSGVNAFTMLHRGFALVAGVLIIAFLVAAYRRGMRFFALATAATLLLQALVGAAAAITDGPAANGLHVALATLVWSGVLTTALLALPRADRASRPAALQVQKTPV